MDKNKIVANGLFITIGLAVFIGIFEEAIDYEMVNSFYTLAGLGMFVFGIWAGVILYKK